MTTTRRPAIDRLMARTIRIDSGCLEWQGHRLKTGYGQIADSGKCRMVHRVAYEHVHGPVPEGLEIDHLCRNRACVEVRHLEAVTHRENLNRKPKPTACPRGHAMSGSNIKLEGGKRRCRRCRNAKQNARRAVIRNARHDA